ncbi:MAG: prolipoprotein diacylglyceryl transferase [Burkholderia sp.]|nr:prolipoprotein diacylglyceryl transferase [Burkholderia sp.]
MLIHPNFDPVAIHLGPIAIHWYGFMYLIAFIMAIVISRIRIKYLCYVKQQGWSAKEIDDIVFYGILGVVLGGRLGYVLFYKPSFYLTHPLEILKIWEGGMSFHGGFLGVTIAMAIFARQGCRKYLQVTDFITPMIPTGLAAGRIGNFINGELWGRVTDPSAPWAMMFPRAISDDVIWFRDHTDLVRMWNLNDVFIQYHMLPRHASQLYEIVLEGFMLFIIIWAYSCKPRPIGATSALFLIVYGLARFMVEFVREPDNFLGLLTFGLSMGQWLSLPMVLAGVFMMKYAYRHHVSN